MWEPCPLYPESRHCRWRISRRDGAIANYSVLLRCSSDVALSECLSIGSLKYMHHFGLECFSTRGEHCNLQASLAHSINELFSLSLASALEFAASALATNDLCGTDFVRDKMCPVGAASLIGFSRSKFPFSAHPARARARSRANGHFIFAPLHGSGAYIVPHHAPDAGGKRRDLRGRLLIC
jgi:hypothetical protein